MVLTTYKLSIEEWHRLVETGIFDGKPVELLEGQIIQMSPEGIEHTYTNHTVGNYLRKLLDGLAVVREAHPVTLDNSEPEPDLAIVRLPENTYATRHPLPQDIYWLVEVSNTTLKVDREEKSSIYAKAGVAEYWVIDLVNKKLIVHTQPQDDRYFQVVEYKSGLVKAQAFPNIEIELDRLLLF